MSVTYWAKTGNSNRTHSEFLTTLLLFIHFLRDFNFYLKKHQPFKYFCSDYLC